MTLTDPRWHEFAGRALAEDHADNDITTALLGEAAEQPAVGRFRAEAAFVVAGLPLIEAVFHELDRGTTMERAVAEGDRVADGEIIAEVHGRGGVLLAGERVALNYLQRLSGIATVTRRAVDAVAGTGAVISDTRKTTPGLRALEKYAVRTGGGVNHRASLADAVLWKDNHWELLGRRAGGLMEALRGVPDGVQVCVEVEDETQLDAAVAAGVDWILVDNQTPDTIASWSRRLGPDIVIEASGGITVDSVRPFAEAGAQRISMGALTYAPDLVSISFEVGLRSSP